MDITKAKIIGKLKTKPLPMLDVNNNKEFTVPATEYDIIQVNDFGAKGKIYVTNKWYKPGVPVIIAEPLVDSYKEVKNEQLTKVYPMIAQFTTKDELKMNNIEKYANQNNGMRMIYDRKPDGSYLIKIYQWGKLNPEAHKKVKELILKEEYIQELKKQESVKQQIKNVIRKQLISEDIKLIPKPNYRVGSIVLVRLPASGSRTIKVKVTKKSKDIDDTGSPRFDGIELNSSNQIVYRNLGGKKIPNTVWTYEDQIIKVEKF
jgi:hypothetical protein